MTHLDIPESAMLYFEQRAKLAALLKEAGVKRHAREYVAEVLLDAGVVDLAELDRLTDAQEGAETPTMPDLVVEWLDKPAWWRGRRGDILSVSITDETALFAPEDGGVTRNIPISWLTHERPEPGPDVA